jgi:hypothetical protein
MPRVSIRLRAHLARKQWLRKRIAEWAKNRERLTDDAFYIALSLPSIPKEAATLVRTTVSHAVRIPGELIGPNDNI